MAYAALSREELELAELARQSTNDSMSVGCIGEAAIVFLIRKEALRRRIHLGGELPYSQGRGKVDLCLLDHADRPLASFELKLVSSNPREARFYWPQAREDVSKHFDPANGIKDACDSHERFNVLFLVIKDDESKVAVESTVGTEIDRILRTPVFFTSDSIKLNGVRTTNPNAQFWNYMRVVVFSGQYAGAIAHTAPAG